MTGSKANCNIRCQNVSNKFPWGAHLGRLRFTMQDAFAVIRVGGVNDYKFKTCPISSITLEQMLDLIYVFLPAYYVPNNQHLPYNQHMPQRHIHT